MGGVLVVFGLWRGSLVLQGLRGGILGALQGGSQGVEEFLELPMGPVLEGLGEAVPVLGHLQQGGEVGRPVDLGLWSGTLGKPGVWGGVPGAALGPRRRARGSSP